MVEAWGDASLARHARNVLRKAETVLPDGLKERLRNVGIYAPDYFIPTTLTDNLEPVRRAVATQRKMRFHYENLEGVATDRVIRPLALYFWGTAWTLVAWCELRTDFRNFRPDRMAEVKVLEEEIPDEPGKDLETFLEQVTRGRDS